MTLGDLHSGLYTCQAGTLLLESCLQSKTNKQTKTDWGEENMDGGWESLEVGG
jgi:hypothetical protein